MTKQEELFAAWLDRTRSKKKRQARFSSSGKSTTLIKSYHHFDAPIASTGSVLSKKLQRVLQDPEQVKKRSFYPFLKVCLETPRFEKKDGKRVKHCEGPKRRLIYYAAHKDALFYSWYSFQLNQFYEKLLKEHQLQECSIAYRSIKKQTTIHFANNAFRQIAAYQSCAVLTFDISKFFDQLNHNRLKANWARVIGETKLPPDHFTLFKSLSSFRYIEAEVVKDIFHGASPTEKREGRYCEPEDFREFVLPFEQKNCTGKGIPQGSPISAVLANIYMLDFDAALNEYANLHDGLYRRYSDDILLIIPREEVKNATEEVKKQLDLVQLPLNEKKSEIRYFSKDADGAFVCLNENGQPAHLQYLGLEFDGNFVRVRSASWSRYHQKLSKAIGKTLAMANGKKKLSEQVFMRTLYKRFTSLSNKSNFIKYAQKVYKVTGSVAVKKQYKNHIHFIQKLIAVKKKQSQV